MKTTYRILLVILTVSIFLLPSSLLAKNITQTTTNKKFSVTMTTPEEGLSVGKNSISLKIYDADDYEVVGATVNVKPWMPGMNHGVFLTPKVQEKDNGVYEVGDVGFSMPGHWQLIVAVSKDSTFDQATFEFQNITGEMGAGCTCGPDCKCEHCTTGEGPCACKLGAKGKAECTCDPDCKCEHCRTGKGPCACKVESKGCACGPNCKCEHCTTGKGPCDCQARAGTGCKMAGGKCQGNCACGCKEGKPCQMKDGKCVGGCGCGCQAGKAAFNCPCGTGGNCPKSCKCGCQSANVPNCKCGPGCTTLINCSCGSNCACAMDGKDGCGCIAGCRSGCPNGVCPLPKKAKTS